MRSEGRARIEVLWQGYMRPAGDPYRLNVISDETFLGNEGSIAEIAHVMQALVGHAHVLIIMRDQVDILRSLYDMYPWFRGDTTRRYLPFQEWLEKTLARAETNIARTLNFVDRVALYRDLFGEDALTVISFHRLFCDAEVRAQLCARLRIDAQAFSNLISQKAANTSADNGTKKLVHRVLGRSGARPSWARGRSGCCWRG
jgi:hypothetical protein